MAWLRGGPKYGAVRPKPRRGAVIRNDGRPKKPLTDLIERAGLIAGRRPPIVLIGDDWWG